LTERGGGEVFRVDIKNCFKIIFFSILLFCFLGMYGKINKLVAGRCEAGFFSDFISVLSYLNWHEKTRIPLVIYWDSQSPYYQPKGYNGSKNVWEYYFEPVSKFSYKPGDIIVRHGSGPDNCYKVESFTKGISRDGDYRKWINSLINKYIKIKPSIQKKINSFYHENMKGKFTIGVHYRGHDHRIEADYPKLPAFITLANNYVKQFPNAQFLIATDEYYGLEEFKNKLKAKIIYYDCFRSKSSIQIHSQNKGAKVGEEVLIEAQLLSKCNLFIHGLSNVSSAALFFNPNLKHVELGTTKKHWLGWAPLAFIIKHLPKDPIIIEIGALYGHYTTFFSYHWERGKIYAFEPNPCACQELERLTRERPNVICSKCALSEKSGTAFLYLAGWQSSLLRPTELLKERYFNFDKANSLNQKILVKSVILDEWAESNNIRNVDLLWLDASGSELKILRGAQDTLKKVKMIFLYNVYNEKLWEECSSYKELKNWLSVKGFTEVWSKMSPYDGKALFIK